MTKFNEKFLKFDATVGKAALAIAEIDGTLGAGHPTLVGDVCIVNFWDRTGDAMNNKYVRDQIDKAEKILKNYGVHYRKLIFSKD